MSYEEPDYEEPEGADFQVEYVAQEREKAIQVVMLDTADLKWIPKSVIHDDSEVYEMGDAGTLVVAMWFAEKERML